MSNENSFSTAAGEHLVLGQLLRKGIAAYLAQGPTQKGWDIIFKRGSHLKTIQVKAISWPEKSAVNGNLTSGFDFLVVVLLDKVNPHPRYLVMRTDEIEPHISKKNPNRKSKGKRTLTVSKEKMNAGGTLLRYENNWEILLAAESSHPGSTT
jgi:hypothetical protein